MEMAERFIVFLVIIVFCLTLPVASQAQKEKLDHLKTWIGKYPLEGRRDFLQLPEVRPTLVRLLGRKYYLRLTDLRRKPYYLITPIEYLDGYFLLEYAPNYHFNQEGDRVVILIRSRDATIHVAVNRGERTKWFHSGDRSVPPEIVTKFTLDGT
jgi:hypothetical protein